MTDPDLWERLCALEPPPVAAPTFEAHIEAGLSLKPGHGAPLYLEYLILIYLEKVAGQRPWASRLLTDFGAWLAFDQPAHFQALMAVAGLSGKPGRVVLPEVETRALYQAEFDCPPLPQVWPRLRRGQGRRRRGVLAAGVIGAAVLWRALAGAIHIPGQGEAELWLPVAVAGLAGLALWLFAPREPVLDPPDAWAEDEAKA